MGFSFGLPFAPYYFQELGIRDPAELKLWVALFAAATPLTLAIASPIWGILADRFGRRLMLLRANLAASVILMLMGVVTQAWQILVLRLAQGVFTGTMTAAQAMVAVHAPRHRSGMALGMLSSSVYSGAMAGVFAGGICADLFGYRIAFMCSGVLLVIAACLVVFATNEKVVRDREPEGSGIVQPVPRGSHARRILPLLVLLGAIAFVRQFDKAFLPLLVQEIHGSLDGVSLWAGWLGGTAGLAGFLSGLIIGRLSDRIAPARIAMLCALGAGIMMIPHGFAHGFGLLFPVRFAAIFCAGGIGPAFAIWLAKVTPEERRGAIFGLAGTAKSLGWMIGPLVAGGVASLYGLRMIYFVACGLFLALIPLVYIVVGAMNRSSAPKR